MSNNPSLDYYWDSFRRRMGFNPNKPMTFKEKMFWGGVRRQREICLNTDDPEVAICDALPFDKQYFLEKWWNKLDIEDKKKYLIHVWLNKGAGLLYGYEWWFPYFKDVGFLTNCGVEKPTEEILLYRGARPQLKYALSWTSNKEFAELFASQSEGYKLYRAVVKPDSILGIIHGVAGSYEGNIHEGLEYIVDYKKILIKEV